jgi:hypothetical protein
MAMTPENELLVRLAHAIAIAPDTDIRHIHDTLMLFAPNVDRFNET